MPYENFWSDLGEGIFGRLGEINKEQEARDYADKGELVKLIGKLADDSDVESRPIVLKHLAEVIGINKNKKFNNFWEAFAGLPSKDMSTRLGAKAKQITDSIMGPGQARGIRQRADIGRLFGSTAQTPFSATPDQMANRQRYVQGEQDLQNKIVLRDPRQEKLEDLKAQYGLQFAQKEYLLNEREELLRRRQEENDKRDYENNLSLVKKRQELKEEQEINELANALAVSKGFSTPNTFHRIEAAKQIAKKYGLNIDLLAQRIGLTGALKTKAEAEAKSMSQNEGMRPGEAARLSDARFQRFQNVKDAYTKSMGNLQAAEGKRAEILKQINDQLSMFPGVKFDPEKGVIAEPVGGRQLTPDEQKRLGGMMAGQVENLRKDYIKLGGDIKAAEIASQGHWQNLGNKQYSRYVKRGATFRDPVTFPEGGEEPATPAEQVGPAQRSQIKGGATLRVPIGQYTADYEVGQIRPYRGRQYRVERSEAGNWILRLVR